MEHVVVRNYDGPNTSSDCYLQCQQAVQVQVVGLHWEPVSKANQIPPPVADPVHQGWAFCQVEVAVPGAFQSEGLAHCND